MYHFLQKSPVSGIWLIFYLKVVYILYAGYQASEMHAPEMWNQDAESLYNGGLCFRTVRLVMYWLGDIKKTTEVRNSIAAIAACFCFKKKLQPVVLFFLSSIFARILFLFHVFK